MRTKTISRHLIPITVYYPNKKKHMAIKGVQTNKTVLFLLLTITLKIVVRIVEVAWLHWEHRRCLCICCAQLCWMKVFWVSGFCIWKLVRSGFVSWNWESYAGGEQVSFLINKAHNISIWNCRRCRLLYSCFWVICNDAGLEIPRGVLSNTSSFLYKMTRDQKSDQSFRCKRNGQPHKP